jgi:hypothetical protein
VLLACVLDWLRLSTGCRDLAALQLIGWLIMLPLLMRRLFLQAMVLHDCHLLLLLGWCLLLASLRVVVLVISWGYESLKWVTACSCSFRGLSYVGSGAPQVQLIYCCCCSCAWDAALLLQLMHSRRC